MAGEVISVAQMRDIDRAAADLGVATRVLMENAGRAVAQAMFARWQPQATAVLCGPGNNGGDGWVAARLLRDAGWPVWVEAVVEPGALTGDAADAARCWSGDTFPLAAARAPTAELYVDALFGAGLSRPLDGRFTALARQSMEAPERFVAVDTPSGLHGDFGRPLGETCFRAGLTVTFVRKKSAHLLAPGRFFCGEIVVADIGAPESVVAAQTIQLWENSPALWRASFPWPRSETHKHARGHALVASGGRGRTGAARLSARAALRVGAGLVSVLSPADAYAENAAQLTEIMLREAKDARAYAEAGQTAQCLVVGPAFGVEDMHLAYLKAALAAPERGPLVLDADALTLLAPFNQRLDPRDVLTPHVGEFKRLFPDLLDAAPTRIAAARQAAARTGCVVLLKGPDTVIAAPDGRAVINATGTPFLATAGSGDVLAGIIGGLIAQGMASFEAAAAGAWLHGRAGETVGPGLVAGDLCEALPDLLNGLAAPELGRCNLG